MFKILKQLSHSFAGLLYPPLCLHCHESLEIRHPIFCSSCLQLMTPIKLSERCPYCFSSDLNIEKDKCCAICRQKSPIFDQMAAVFDYEGPAATLIKRLKYGGQPYLAKGAGAYLTAQFLELNWPIPDYIVPMPMSALRRIDRGYNQSLLLAEAMSSLLNSPVYNVLKRRGGDFSQAGLNHHQRLKLSAETFMLRQDTKLYDKCLLVIDDVMTTGSSLRCCAEVLRGLYPKSIYALTVCRAI